MAASLKSPWVAVHIETPRDAELSSAAREQLAQNLRLVEQLGGETATLSGENVAEELIQYARSRNATKIVVGKPKQPRWKEMFRGSLVYELARKCGDIDVYVISGDPQPAVAPVVSPHLLHGSRVGYLWAILVVLLCTGVGGALSMLKLEPTNLAMIYLAGVVAVALRLGRGPSILTAVLSIAAFDFCFVPPHWRFAVDDTQYLLTFLVMLLTAFVISTLTARVQFQAESARRRERRTAALYAMSRELAATPSREQIARIAARHVMAASDVRAVVLLPDQNRQLTPSGADDPGFALSVHEAAVAKWVLEHGQTAGRGTATLPGSEGVYFPLSTSRGAVGVLGAIPSSAAKIVDTEQVHLLEAFAGLIAIALERADLELQADQIRLDIETERLRSALLSAVSHDLRTPLSVITGASSTLLESDRPLEAEVRHELAASILEESERLNRLVANLLDMTRLQAGALNVRKEWQPIEEVIGASLGRLSRQLKDHPVATHIAADLPFAPLDDLLIQQVLVNLLENVARHTPAGTPIEIAARHEGDSIVVEVADRGPGLPPGDPNRLFEKFYTGKGDAAQLREPPGETFGQIAPVSFSRGAGLGLAICRGIVQLHGGKIQAENRPDGGAVFSFSLPLEGKPPDVDDAGQ
jgi:two-component system sensor histidine kinase KdpD